MKKLFTILLSSFFCLSVSGQIVELKPTKSYPITIPVVEENDYDETES